MIFDAGPLITVCKFSVAGRQIVDYILSHCEITIVASVRDEVVIAGNRYPDAQVARQRIDNGQIAVLSAPSNPALEAIITLYSLGDGERDTILLTEHASLQNATLVIDDHLAYLVCDRLGCRKQFLLDVIANLASTGKLDKGLAINIVQAIRSRYPLAFIEHTLLLLHG